MGRPIRRMRGERHVLPFTRAHHFGYLLRLPTLLLICVCAAGAVQAGVCPNYPSGSLQQYSSLGSCTLPNSSAVLSNFRYDLSATGGSAPDPSTSSALVDKSSYGISMPLSYPATSRNLTLHMAYTITVPSGSITAAQVDLIGTALYLDGSNPSGTATMTLCLGGTFTGLTTSGCAGKVIAVPQAMYSQANPGQVVSQPANFAGVASIDVSVTEVFSGSVTYIGSTQAFTFSATPPAPLITELQNNYGRLPPGVPNYGIAPGSIFIIEGLGLGPDPLVSQLGTVPLALSLGGVVTKVTVGGTTVQAIPYYVWNKQIGAILPSNTPTGDGTVEVDYNGGAGTAPIHVVRSAFGMLTLDQTGTGTVAGYDLNGHFVTPTNALNPGEYVSLWGTGLGPAPGDETNIMPQTDLGASVPIEVDIGGVPGTVNYHGRAAFTGGLDQVNVQIPSGVSGCYVPVVVKTGSISSNVGSIAVAASGRKCSDSVTGLTTGDSIIWNKSDPTIASFTVGRQTAPGGFGVSNNDSSSAQFLKVTGGFANLPVAPQPSTGCTISYTAALAPGGVTTLNAGGQLTLQGNGNVALPMNTTTGIYATSPATQGFFSAGASYTMTNGSGGTDVPAFSVPLTGATPLTWSNQGQVSTSISTGSAVDVAWTGGAAGQYAVISGQSNPTDTSTTTSFLCTAPLTAGHFTIPIDVLSALPAGTGTLSVGTNTTPSAPVVPGIDRTFVWSSAINTKSVIYTKP